MVELTALGPKNIEAFEPLMQGADISDYELCIGAILEDEAAGVALFNTLGGALMLDYIFVAPSHRRKGVGRTLVSGFLQEISMALPASLYINYPEKAADLYGFSRALGFKLFRDGLSYRTPLDAILDSPDLERLLKAGKNNPVVPISGLSKHEKLDIRNKLEKNDMESGIIDNKSLSPELSLAVLDKKTKETVSLVLCSRSGKELMIEYLINFTDNPVYLVDLLGGLKAAVIKEGLRDKELVFVAMNEDMERLPKKLVGPEGILSEEGAVISGVLVFSKKED